MEFIQDQFSHFFKFRLYSNFKVCFMEFKKREIQSLIYIIMNSNLYSKLLSDY